MYFLHSPIPQYTLEYGFPGLDTGRLYPILHIWSRFWIMGQISPWKAGWLESRKELVLRAMVLHLVSVSVSPYVANRKYDRFFSANGGPSPNVDHVLTENKLSATRSILAVVFCFCFCDLFALHFHPGYSLWISFIRSYRWHGSVSAAKCSQMSWEQGCLWRWRFSTE